MPIEFTCFDDSPFNNGWREVDEDLEGEEPDEDILEEEDFEPHTENNF